MQAQAPRDIPSSYRDHSMVIHKCTNLICYPLFCDLDCIICQVYKPRETHEPQSFLHHVGEAPLQHTFQYVKNYMEQ